MALTTGHEVRLASRQNKCRTTSGLAPNYVQTNLIVLPIRYAEDFRQLCQRNPVPCPLIAESASPGCWNKFRSCIPGIDGSRVVADIDVRRDAPRYHVYQDGILVKEACLNIDGEWKEDHVAFLIGCSFTFEAALTDAGLLPRHILQGRNVPMYRTRLPLCPSGVFKGSTFVVSLRCYPASKIDMVRKITQAFGYTHGEPIAWGWDAIEALGIADIDAPEWGDSPLSIESKPLSQVRGSEADVPVFWACGVTPQEAVMRAGLAGTVMAHAPGHMVVLDILNRDLASL